MDVWSERLGSHNDSKPWRDPYGNDRARVIHSSSFRRLQGKTQVLGLGESDFYRTRLTHSIEVAQIASGVLEYLRSTSECDQYNDILPSYHLLEAIGLSHDIGHPPFGHGGEVALNYKMHGRGGFEGNAQTLRIASTLGEYSIGNGFNLTRRALLGLIKYPARYSEVVRPNVYEYGERSAPLNLDGFKPPKCIYDSDCRVMDFILDAFGESDRDLFRSFQEIDGKHAKTKYKSLDTSIMEVADDIAYGVHDLEDAVALGLVKQSSWDGQVRSKILDAGAEYPLGEQICCITENLFSGDGIERKSAISRLVGYFVSSTEFFVSDEGFEHDIFKVNVRVQEDARRLLDLLQEFVRKNVIKIPEVQALEYKGQQMIVRLFDTIEANPGRLLPKKYFDRYESADGDARVICDYLAGTTDDYATRLYHKLFTPSTGSIFDKL